MQDITKMWTLLANRIWYKRSANNLRNDFSQEISCHALPRSPRAPAKHGVKQDFWCSLQWAEKAKARCYSSQCHRADWWLWIQVEISFHDSYPKSMSLCPRQIKLQIFVKIRSVTYAYLIRYDNFSNYFSLEIVSVKEFQEERRLQVNVAITIWMDRASAGDLVQKCLNMQDKWQFNFQ